MNLKISILQQELNQTRESNQSINNIMPYFDLNIPKSYLYISHGNQPVLTEWLGLVGMKR